MSDEAKPDLRAMLAQYLALGRKALRYWKRAAVLGVVVLAAGLYWVIQRPRVYRSEASASIHDVGVESLERGSAEEAQNELKARLDQIYGSRANLDRVITELNLYPWLAHATSRLKIIEAFRDALGYTTAGRDAFRLDFTYKDPQMAQRTLERLLTLYSETRRQNGQVAARDDVTSVNTAISGLEQVLSSQEERLERFERANRDMVEQVRLRRLGQMQARLGPGAVNAAALQPEGLSSGPDDSPRVRRIRIRLGALANRQAALTRALATPPPVAAAPVGDSERVTTMRHDLGEMRERLARLLTTYTDEYPDVRVLRARITDAQRDLDTQLAQERAGRVAAVAESDPNAIRTQLDSVAHEMELARADLVAAERDERAHAVRPAPVPIAPPTTGPTPPAPSVVAPPAVAAFPTAEDRPLGSLVEVESAWDRLTTELSASRTRYQQLLTRKFELQATLDTVNTTGADVLRVIDPPSLPTEPEPPGRTKLALIVIVLATLLSAAAAILSALIDSRIHHPADLARWGELPLLPPIPDLRASSATLSGPPAPRPYS